MLFFADYFILRSEPQRVDFVWIDSESDEKIRAGLKEMNWTKVDVSVT